MWWLCSLLALLADRGAAETYAGCTAASPHVIINGDCFTPLDHTTTPSRSAVESLCAPGIPAFVPLQSQLTALSAASIPDGMVGLCTRRRVRAIQTRSGSGSCPPATSCTDDRIGTYRWRLCQS